MTDDLPAANAVTLGRGLTLHNEGKLAEAEQIYREILRREPKHFDALHLLGVVVAQSGRLELSAELIARALALNCNVAAARCNLGLALLKLGRFAETVA